MVKRRLLIFIFLLSILLGGLYYLFRPSCVSVSEDIFINVDVMSSDALAISIENKTDASVIFSEVYYIEKKSFWGWRKNSIAPTTFVTCSSFLEANKKADRAIHLHSILKNGQYRLIKQFDINGEVVNIAGYFDIF